MSEEITEETGEQGLYPPVVQETSIPSGKKYGSFLDFMNHQPKRAPERAPKPQPSLHDHFKPVTSARERFKDATAAEEARKEKLAKCQEELWVLEEQRGVLEKQKAEVFLSGDRARMTDLSQDIEINQHQIALKSAEVDALFTGEDTRALLHEVREAERHFYAMVLESYKKQVTSGTCDLPFSLLLRRAYALGLHCGVGDIKDYLFQWVHIPTLAGPDVEGLLQDIEKELRDE